MDLIRLGLLGLLVAVGLASAQGTGTVILPPGYDAAKAYPVVFFLPASGASSAQLLERYIWDVNGGAALSQPREAQLEAFLNQLFPDGTHPGRDFILVLAAGQGSSSDYSTADAWAKTLERYDKQILGDLSALSATRKIDTSRVVVAGFSLGADLAWALALRNPSKLRGAIVMSSRASYRSSSAYATLAKGGARFYLSIGSQDASRIAGAKAAAQLLKDNKVPGLYCELVGVGHQTAPAEVLAEALDFLLTKPAAGVAVPTKPSSKLCR